MLYNRGMQDQVVAPLSPDAKEFRRIRAWELYQQGWKQADIARALGVTFGAVSQWIKRGREGGTESLKKGAVGGSHSRLTEEQLKRLDELLRRGAEAFGFLGNVWTQRRVATVIEREFGIKYHPFSMYRVLRRLGWSQQKPIRRASQRKEAAIKEWLSERWPALKERQ
jgi:transposase